MNPTKTSLVVALLTALTVAPLSARAATSAAAPSDYSAVFDGPRWGDATTPPAPGVSVTPQVRRGTTTSPPFDGTWPQIEHALPPIPLRVYVAPDPEPAIQNDGLRQPVRPFLALGVPADAK
jgi:hypothetical protein